MNASAPPKWNHLSPNPKSSYKQLFVSGTRIRARILYGMFMSVDEPMTPEGIAEDYGLPVEAVREAIAYCETQPPEIAEDFEREERLVAASSTKVRPVSPTEVARILSS